MAEVRPLLTVARKYTVAMILSSGSSAWAGAAPWWLGVGAVLAYMLAMVSRPAVETSAATVPLSSGKDWPTAVFVVGWCLHMALLLLDISGWGVQARGARLGFAPVLSITVWMVIAVHAIESRMVPLPAVRRILALIGALAVLLTVVFPGEVRPFQNPWAPIHFVLGVMSYGLFGVAVLHALMLDAAERRLRERRMPGKAAGAFGLPLLQLERLTFRFVAAGFVALSATLLLGLLTSSTWNWLDRKAILSVLGWAVFAALLLGRHTRGWRGRRATAWLYGGAFLLLLAYAGSRFVMEVVLQRT